MTGDSVPVSGVEFALFAGDEVQLWSRLEGATIEHRDHGSGRIVKVGQYQGLPLIHLGFPSQTRDIVYKPDGLRSGRVASIHIPAELARPFILWKQAQKAAEEEQAKKVAEELRARKAAEAEHRKGAAIRLAQCFKCQQPLDNGVDPTCPTCQWMICRCGSCGCGFLSGRWLEVRQALERLRAKK